MILHIFASTASGKSIRIDVGGFTPFFYIRLPSGSPADIKAAKLALTGYLELHIYEQVSNIDFEDVEKEVLFEYTGGAKYPFLKLTFPSLKLFRAVKNLFLNPETQKPCLIPDCYELGAPFIPGVNPEIFEANLDPMLRFLHIQNLTACGWATLDGIEESELEENDVLECPDYTDILPLAGPPPRPTAPFLIASWDIECFSQTGDFPLAQRRYANVIKSFLENPAITTADEFGRRFSAAVFDSKGSRSEIKLKTLQGKKPLKRSDIESFLMSGQFEATINAFLAARSGMKYDARQEEIQKLGAELDRIFGKHQMPAGDPAIQIGTVLRRLGSPESEQHIFVFPSCDPIPGAKVHVFPSEKEMIRGWCKWIAARNPDILTGFNVFGFDERYVWERAVELGLTTEVAATRKGGSSTPAPELEALSRLCSFGSHIRLEEKFLSSSALGDNFMYVWSTDGRLQIDLYNYVKRSYNLPSYKLDEVTKNFMSGKRKGLVIDKAAGQIRLEVGKSAATEVGLGRSIVLLDELGESLTDKMAVVGVDGETLVLSAADELEFDSEDAVKWVVVKDDVSPQELFKLHLGSAADRATIGRYCIQDCELVLDLFKKLDVFNNAMSMANVCSVPVNYIFSRGQGIKCESLIFKFCHAKNQAIIVLPAPRNNGSNPFAKGGDDDALVEDDSEPEDSYEGAIVLDPKAGFYTESPVGVCDFASLYPSTIISENISHDSLVWIRDYRDDGSLIEQIFGSDKFDGLPGIDYTDIEFDLLRPDPADTRKIPTKLKVGTRVCRYAQNVKGTIPEILQGLLAKRKATRKQAEKETDPFKKALLDAEQNAYKITANSLYGQLGSGTFKVRLQSLAASVTAYGRKQILFAKAAIEQFYGPDAADPRCSAETVYGDTDSLFIAFNPRDPATGQRLEGRAAVEATIHLTEEAGKFVSGALKAPHDFEFDKVYWPFLIFSKKRYIGNMYEENADNFKQAFMGVALKRRDYAQIVKTIYGGAIKILLNKKNIPEAVDFVKKCAVDLVNGQYGFGQLLISKSLRADYANPLGVAHKVLADRITARDPGNAPAVGDRISYVYVATDVGKEAPKLQGERIETPSYIKQKGLLPDYRFYIEHQIANPICQMFGLLLDKIPEYGLGAPLPEKEADRESAAFNILFKDAIAITNKGKAREFLGLLGGKVETKTKPVRQAAVKSRTVVPQGKQTSLDTWYADSAIVKECTRINNIKKKLSDTNKNGTE
jgi:DNA polymerase elongation subunit (family B)